MFKKICKAILKRVDSFANTFVNTFVGVLTCFEPQHVRIIETRGCMGEDYSYQNGFILRRVTRNVYDGNPGGVNVDFYIIKLNDEQVIERPVTEGFFAEDGVLEFRR